MKEQKALLWNITETNHSSRKHELLFGQKKMRQIAKMIVI